MNPFILGKLAEIHIQSLFDSANGSRNDSACYLPVP
jgi:hypothetical protein